MVRSDSHGLSADRYGEREELVKAYHDYNFGNLKANARAKRQASDYLATRGLPGRPPAPRDVQIQSGARKVLLTWKLAPNDQTTAHWRVYRDTESNLVMEIADLGTRQMFLDVTSGATPPVYNFFVSGVSQLGVEGPKVQVQGSAEVEAGAPSDPSLPPGYTDESSGGGSTHYSGSGSRGGSKNSN